MIVQHYQNYLSPKDISSCDSHIFEQCGFLSRAGLVSSPFTSRISFGAQKSWQCRCSPLLWCLVLRQCTKSWFGFGLVFLGFFWLVCFFVCFCLVGFFVVFWVCGVFFVVVVLVWFWFFLFCFFLWFFFLGWCFLLLSIFGGFLYFYKTN